MKKLSKKTKRKLIIFAIKTAIYIVVGLVIWHISAAKHRQTEKDIGENIVAEEIDEAIEDGIEVVKYEPQNDFYIAECNLSWEMQKVAYNACNDTGIPFNVALGLIEVESNFNAYAVNETTGCYGYCQLHPKYFPSDLSPEENITTGIKWLAMLYGNNGGNMAKALTIYNAGHDNGSRIYASKVLKAAEKWGE